MNPNDRSRKASATKNRGMAQLFGRATLSFALPLALLLASGCGKDGDKAKKSSKAPVPVSVAKAELKNVPLVFDTFGLVEPFAKVSIKPQVTGRIEKIEFTPGQRVSKGQTLIRLDARPFQAELQMAEAAHSKNSILLEDAQRLSELKSKLYTSKIVTEDEMLRLKAAAKAAAAALHSDKADIERKRLDIEYCTIAAPFDGRVGDILMHEGAVVKADETSIVEVTRTEPAYVAFSLPERFLPVVQSLLAAGEKPSVLATTTGDRRKQYSGELHFIDNTVNQNSGTVKMKALFQNPDGALWPGQYVDVSINLSKGKESFATVPSESIQPGQDGFHVFIVKPDSSVEMRQVAIERTAGRETAVASGLNPGETVVVAGQFLLSSGAKVSVKDAPSATESAPTDAKKP